MKGLVIGALALQLTSTNNAGVISVMPAVTCPGGQFVNAITVNGVASCVGGAGGGDLLAANNLSDVASAATSRTNLGVPAGSGSSTGTNTGDQTITLTGDVTGGGVGSFAATVAGNAVTNAKLAQMANATFKCRNTSGTGSAEDCTVAQVQALLKTPKHVFLAADSALSTVTKTNLTGMAFTLSPSTNYSYLCKMYTTANAVTVGVQFSITFGGTVTAVRGMFEGPGTATTLLWIADTSFPLDFNPTASQGNVAGMVTLSGTIEVSGTGGTLQFQHASETATLTTVQRGSPCSVTIY